MAKSIIQSDWDRCYLCGRPATETSEKYGLKVRLCHNCHTGSDHSAQYDPEKNRMLKIEAQMAFEQLYGHDKWMQTFRRNYIFEQERIEG